MTAQYFFECKECEYDSDEAGHLTYATVAICPICAGDTGRDVDLTFRPATAEEIVRLAPAKK